MTDTNDKEELASWLSGGWSNPDWEFEMKKRAISKDTRVRKEHNYSNIDSEYKKLCAWKRSSECAYTNAAKNLLSSFPVDSNDLKATMVHNYSMSDQEYDNVLRHLANDKNVEVSKNKFTGSITIKRKGDNV
jgi:hypothetical protein